MNTALTSGYLQLKQFHMHISGAYNVTWVLSE